MVICPLRSLKLAPSAPQGAHVNNQLPKKYSKCFYQRFYIGASHPPEKICGSESYPNRNHFNFSIVGLLQSTH